MRKLVRSSARLPNGKATQSDRRYIREWRKFTKHIVAALAKGGEPGWTVYAYDPGVRLTKEWKASLELGQTEARALARLGGWKDV